MNDDQQPHFPSWPTPGPGGSPQPGQAAPATTWAGSRLPSAPPPAPNAAWGGYLSAPPPNQDTGRAVWIIVGIIGGFIAIIILAAIAVPVFLNTTTIKPATKAATTYLTDTQTGNYVGAYSMLCSQDRSNVSENEFVAAKTALHPLSFSTGQATRHHTVLGQVVIVPYTESESDGRPYAAVLPVVKQDGSWLVCHSVLTPNWL